LRADIDYALTEAKTIYGIIGVKVWIFKGELYGKVDLSPNAGTAEKRSSGGQGPSNERGNERGNDRGGKRFEGRERGGNERGGGGNERGGGGGGRRRGGR